ncbi:hypothetical protein GCM10011392_04010 [Wenxinia marina]|uniref:Uncharacterized protein n=1 Tax=Wenxinia marina DSM 24838 TaxID=1123501 RepID=A0A0D0NQC0_9RHOB|nr:hypothetical protein Wenmar_00851 [Wenxinia marina DSM 24838]GGL52816.1 hypothetical protein GCM10011392_04010 [Wenxinia marina]
MAALAGRGAAPEQKPLFDIQPGQPVLTLTPGDLGGWLEGSEAEAAALMWPVSGGTLRVEPAEGVDRRGLRRCLNAVREAAPVQVGPTRPGPDPGPRPISR